MPHSLYLGSGLVQSRLKDYDLRHGFWASPSTQVLTASQSDAPVLSALEIEKEEANYRPSLIAIRNCLPYSLAELVFSLVTFALFINS